MHVTTAGAPGLVCGTFEDPPEGWAESDLFATGASSGYPALRKASDLIGRNAQSLQQGTGKGPDLLSRQGQQQMPGAHLGAASTRGFRVGQLDDLFHRVGKAELVGLLIDKGRHLRPALEALVPGQRELRFLNGDAGVPATTIARLAGQARKVCAQLLDGGHLAGAAGALKLPRLVPEMLPVWTTGKGTGHAYPLSEAPGCSPDRQKEGRDVERGGVGCALTANVDAPPKALFLKVPRLEVCGQRGAAGWAAPG